MVMKFSKFKSIANTLHFLKLYCHYQYITEKSMNYVMSLQVMNYFNSMQGRRGGGGGGGGGGVGNGGGPSLDPCISEGGGHCLLLSFYKH